MKKIKIFNALFVALAVGCLLTAFTKASTTAPLRVIVDEIIFVTEAANLVQDTTLSALNNLPNVYQKKDTGSIISWYDRNALREGYFVRIEEVGKNSVKVTGVVAVGQFNPTASPTNRTMTYLLKGAELDKADEIFGEELYAVVRLRNLDLNLLVERKSPVLNINL
jgi:hypothetical protein